MRRTNLTLVIVFILLHSLQPTSPYARTWYVTTDGTGDAPTIQAAIDSSAAGDTVLVATGIYEGATIGIGYYNSRLTLLSENGDENTIFKNPSYVIIDNCNHIVFKGFTITDSQTRALLINLCDSVLIDSNVFYNNSGYAIETVYSSNVIISNNLIYSNLNGIGTIDCAEQFVISNNTIAYNNDNGNAYGVFLDNCGSYRVNNNIVTQNDVGIYTWCMAIEFECNDVVANGSNYQLIMLPDPTGDNGNMSYIIQFCAIDPLESGNFYIQSGSPCAPGNNPDMQECHLIGRYPVGCDSVGVKETSWSGIKGRF